MNSFLRKLIILTSVLSSAFLTTNVASAKLIPVKEVKNQTETLLRSIVSPVLNKYCVEQCKILTVDVDVQVAVPDEVAPGFEEVTSNETFEYAPASAKIVLLVDEMVGAQSKSKILNLLQVHLNSHPFPIVIEAQSVPFPLPVSTARKVAELRERAESQFKAALENLFRQVCPDQCMLADFKLDVEAVNGEEAQYGSSSEFLQDGDLAVRIRKIDASIILDSTLTPQERANVLEMARLRTAAYRNVELKGMTMQFPMSKKLRLLAGGGLVGEGGTESEKKTSQESKNELSSQSTNQTKNESTDSKTENLNQTNSNQLSSSENNQRQEKYERFEKIERVENGDEVQKQMKRFGMYALIFGCAVLSLLIFVVMSVLRAKNASQKDTIIQKGFSSEPPQASAATPEPRTSGANMSLIAKRYEIDRLKSDLMKLFAEYPKVAKHVFSRVLTEEGVEITSGYLSIFGESIVMDLLRDPTHQADMMELTEYYARNPIELTDDEQLDLLRSLHNKAIAAKMVVMGNRSAGLFEFVAEMDARQILEMIQNESMTVKAIVMTQCDPQKRAKIFGQFDERVRMELLNELSRIDHLPRDYIHNVAAALHRKRKENPRLNTEVLPGSDVLVTLLERVGVDTQRNVVKSLQSHNPDSASSVKSKLVSVDTLPYLRDQQLLDVILSLRHDELLMFLKGANEKIRNAIFEKSPADLVADIQDELQVVSNFSRENYHNVERKILNRIKVMANEGGINLVETNERMFLAENGSDVVTSITDRKAAGY